ncbi:Na+/H+ antiporter [Bacillus thermotolerans]|nr:Na+/H+ antiporter [Bacillus thermotolerans]
MLVPVIGAVLAGTVFGEHTSPLSDTTILASIGSSVHPIDHMMTQLPYAVLCSLASIIGFLVLGFTNNSMIGLLVALVVVAAGAFILKNRSDKLAGELRINEEIAK